jgi:hypothetical protein
MANATDQVLSLEEHAARSVGMYAGKKKKKKEEDPLLVNSRTNLWNTTIMTSGQQERKKRKEKKKKTKRPEPSQISRQFSGPDRVHEAPRVLA